ncbi:amidohydrolase family protein [Oscillospiraceae bacterium OttesenSCG-928-G22]|nr:amidohydrolase family protein [Oscillospiraceae bacterium OttesenSCG-928-G22]
MLDTIIHGGIVVTMADENGTGVINNGAVGIKGNKIEAVGETKDILAAHKAHRYVDAKNRVVMPGFIDAHAHSGLGLMKGLAQDMDNWLQRGLWPFDEFLTVEDGIRGSMMHVMEAMKAGTTTIVDYDSPMDELVKNHIRIGTRVVAGQNITSLGDGYSTMPVGELYPYDPAVGEEKFRQAKQLIDTYHESENGRIRCMLAPVSPDRVERELLLEVKALADKIDIDVYMHLACGKRETLQVEKRYSKRSIGFLDELGYLNSRLRGIHLSEATPDELAHFAKKGCTMVLCSGSEAIIDGNIPPAYEFLENSRMLALGSDQTPGGNVSNMFNEMKFTAILNKCKRENPVIFPSWQVLRMATIDGARAIGLGDDIGSLEAGKKADIIILNFELPHLTPIIRRPIRNIVPNLVYAANGSEVETVIIDGKFTMENRKVLTVDEAAEVAAANAAADALMDRLGDSVMRVDDSEMVRMMKDGKI